MTQRTQWGWAGTVTEFLETPRDPWLGSLRTHHEGLFASEPAGTQVVAWKEQYEVLRLALRELCDADSSASGWGITFEYELPLEGGRRPDVVILTGASIAVLEFKSGSRLHAAFGDQVAAYARDLSEYHEGSHGKKIDSAVVLTRARFPGETANGVAVLDPASLSGFIRKTASAGSIPLETWLNSRYAPLPTLVEAARRIFRHEPLPHVKRALSAGIPEAVALLKKLAADASREKARYLIFLAGVPGSGKTLAGLRFVYEASVDAADAMFLSGNGPLVEVLQDALKSRVFVRDLHRFIREYGINGKTPTEHVVVFDEAQRAWDSAYMLKQRGVDRGEPELLITAGEKIRDWASLVGLVGDGQEIYSGEEGGLQQWAESAQPPIAKKLWTVHCPPRLADAFCGLAVKAHAPLDLTISLRSRRAEQLHSWVATLLEGNLGFAARHAMRIHGEAFPLHLTRNLDEAKTYARQRYEGEPERRYGLLASSGARSLPSYGVDNSWDATRRLRTARWFNAPPTDPSSCCSLEAVVTEFQCQGLELDLPIVCWGDDLLWTGTVWKLMPPRRRYQQKDPEQILKNVYRVLLTRGRDGVLVFIPPGASFDHTEQALLAAGVRPLPEELEHAAIA
ncbi:MAG: DNA/RNA helicase domain-containing protein [Thermoanaerobaculia bacterium]